MVDGELRGRPLGRPRRRRDRAARGASARRPSIFSGTKGVVATALLLLVERGELELDGARRELWPEFAAGGKGEVTVAQLLAHCGGLPGSQLPLAFDDPQAIARALAAQAPIVPVGSAVLPRADLRLAGRRARSGAIDGRGVGAFVREEIALPLGELDLRIGLAAGDELAPRAGAPARGAGLRARAPSRAAEPDPRLELVYGGARAHCPMSGTIRACSQPGVPAAGGVATARALATLYGRIVDGGGPARARDARARHARTGRRRGSAHAAGSCASGRRATSWRARRARSARPPTPSGTRAQAARRTAAGRHCAPGSRTSRPNCGAKSGDERARSAAGGAARGADAR